MSATKSKRFPAVSALVIGQWTFTRFTMGTPPRDVYVATSGGDEITLSRKWTETLWRFVVDVESVGSFHSHAAFTERLDCANAALRAYHKVNGIH